MIKINKLDEPTILSNNKDNWTNELLNIIQSGNKVPSTIYNRYNNKEIKNKLKEESNNKCMYCESVIGHIAHEHIEHFRPKAKSKYPQLTYEWNNLGLSCPICNMNKRDEFDEDLPFINPYFEEPNDFFIALGNMIYPKLGNRRAELTRSIIKLNRPELIERRTERLNTIELLINRYSEASNETLKQAILNEILIEIETDKPYSMCAKSLFNLLTNSLD